MPRSAVTVITVNGGPMDIENFKKGKLDYCLSLSPGLHGMICATNLLAYMNKQTYQKKTYSPIVWTTKNELAAEAHPLGDGRELDPGGQRVHEDRPVQARAAEELIFSNCCSRGSREASPADPLFAYPAAQGGKRGGRQHPGSHPDQQELPGSAGPGGGGFRPAPGGDPGPGRAERGGQVHLHRDRGRLAAPGLRPDRPGGQDLSRPWTLRSPSSWASRRSTRKTSWSASFPWPRTSTSTTCPRTAGGCVDYAGCRKAAAALLAELGISITLEQEAHRAHLHREEAGQHRQGLLPQGQGAHPGRADRLAGREGQEDPVRHHPPGHPAGPERHLHLPQPGRDLRDRRPGDRVQGRQEGGHPRRGGDQHGHGHPGDDRPLLVLAVQPGAGPRRRRRGEAGSDRLLPGGSGGARVLRGASGGDLRDRRPGRRRPHRAGPDDLRAGPPGLGAAGLPRARTSPPPARSTPSARASAS